MVRKKNIKVDRSSPVPVYYQIETDLKDRIINKEWQVNEQLPTEEELAHQYEVSRLTVRQALAELEKDGIIHKERGKGTFIDEDPSPFVTELTYSLVSSNRLSTRFRHTISAEILEKKLLTDLFPDVAEGLNLSGDGAAVYIKRLFRCNNRPIAVSRNYINARFAPDLADRPLVNNSISQSLREYYQLEAHSVDDKIEAVRATQEDVQILRCSYNSPLMLVSGIAYAPSGEPMEYSRTLWIGDSVRFHLHLQRNEKNGPMSLHG